MKLFNWNVIVRFGLDKRQAALFTLQRVTMDMYLPTLRFKRYDACRKHHHGKHVAPSVQSLCMHGHARSFRWWFEIMSTHPVTEPVHLASQNPMSRSTSYIPLYSRFEILTGELWSGFVIDCSPTGFLKALVKINELITHERLKWTN